MNGLYMNLKHNKYGLMISKHNLLFTKEWGFSDVLFSEIKKHIHDLFYKSKMQTLGLNYLNILTEHI